VEIFINGEKIPFELEKEENALDIINAIADYASKANPQQFITAIYINEIEHSYADEKKLKNIPIENINKLEIETKGIYGITMLSINQIEKFTDILLDIINSEKWESSFSKISESLKWMNDGIIQIINIFSSEKEKYLINLGKEFYDHYNKIYSFFKNIKPESFPLKTEEKEYALIEIKNIQSIISDIKKWLQDTYKFFDRELILDNINSLIKLIDEIVPKISNVPILFQTGEDQEAMNIIKMLANILENSIGLFAIFKEDSKLHLDKYTVKEVSFEMFFKTMTEHLKDLMNAIENNDSIMIGDLLEYEFIPNIEEIKNIFTKIKEEAFEKAN